MDEYTHYTHFSRYRREKSKSATKQILNTKLMKIHTKTTKYPLCSIDTNTLQYLYQMDETKADGMPYIDGNAICEIRYMHAKNGKYTQYIVTTYQEYDTTPSMQCLPPIPQDENDDKLHTEQKHSTQIDCLKTEIETHANKRIDNEYLDSKSYVDNVNDESGEQKSIDIKNAYSGYEYQKKSTNLFHFEQRTSWNSEKLHKLEEELHKQMKLLGSKSKVDGL
eukprot:174395_1